MSEALALSKILLPVEFSDRCRGAARYAEALACRFNAELVLLHVVPPAYAVYGGAGEVSAYCSMAEVAAERVQQGQSQLDAFAAEAPPSLALRPVLLEGDPATRIVEFADAERFDLIVMPTHGYGPFRRFLIGSVTAKVLHDVDCPVWTGPHLEEAPEYNAMKWRRFACAVDLGSHTAAVLAWAGAMAKAYGSELAVIHALPGSMKELGGITFDPEWAAHAAADAREQIAGILESLELCASINIEVGDAPAAVRRGAEAVEADLLVIGRSIHPGVIGRLRANAYAIVRESPCPVVSI